MDKLTTIWIVIAVYAIFMLVVGILNSSKDNGSSMEKFTVGGRNAGAWISALSYGTAYFSAVMFIGYSGGSGYRELNIISRPEGKCFQVFSLY